MTITKMDTIFYVLKAEEYYDTKNIPDKDKQFQNTNYRSLLHDEFFDRDAEVHLWTRDSEMNDVLIRIKDFYYKIIIEIPEHNNNNSLQHTKDFYRRFSNYIKSLPNVRGCRTQKYFNYKLNRHEMFFEVDLRNSYTAKYFKQEFKNELKQFHSKFHVHEYNQSLPLQFIAYNNLTFSGWIEMKDGQEIKDDEKISVCSREFICKSEDLQLVPEEEQPDILVNPVILAYDLECKSPTRTFPDPTKYEDEIMIISASVSRKQGEYKNYSFCLYGYHSDEPMDAEEIFAFDREKDMLIAFQKFIQDVNPDIIIGYNSDSFDNPYLVQRIYNYGMPLLNFSKLKDHEVKTKFKWRRDEGNDGLTMRKYLHRERMDRAKEFLLMAGRMHLDVMLYIMKNYTRFRSYSLDNMSKHFLKDKKDDVSFRDMSDAFLGYGKSPELNELYYKVVRYGIQDSLLTIKLFEKLQMFMGMSMQAHVNSINIDMLLTEGSSVAVKSMIYRKCKEERIVFQPHSAEKKSKYQGAFVLDPQSGVYERVYTLDLDSLYPNIIRSYNICFTTILRDSFKKPVKNKNKVYRIPIGQNVYEFMDDRQGILPKLCEYLIEKRTEVRKRKTDSEIIARVNDALQLALKISANSIYGFLGIAGDPFGFIEGASSVTAMGRRIIKQIKDRIEDKFNHEVIYGDTDSVMCRTGLSTEKEAYHIALEVRDDLNHWLKTEVGKNLGLKLEKVGTIFLLQKKKYIYHYWDFDKEEFEVDGKGNNIYHVTGAESVRRDKCPYQGRVFDYLCDLVIKGKTKEDIFQEICECIINFISRYHRPDERPLTLDDLLINYSINDSYEESSNYMLKILSQRLKDENYQIQSGDRINTVLCKLPKENKKTVKMGEKIFMDKQYLDYKEKGKHIDLDLFCYIENRLVNVFDKTFCRAYAVSEDIHPKITEIPEKYIKNLLEDFYKLVHDRKDDAWMKFFEKYKNFREDYKQFFDLVFGDPFSTSKRTTLAKKSMAEVAIHYYNLDMRNKEKGRRTKSKLTEEYKDLFIENKYFKILKFRINRLVEFLGMKRFCHLPAKTMIKILDDHLMIMKSIRPGEIKLSKSTKEEEEILVR